MQGTGPEEISYDKFLKLVDGGEVEEVTLSSTRIYITLKDNAGKDDAKDAGDTADGSTDTAEDTADASGNAADTSENTGDAAGNAADTSENAGDIDTAGDAAGTSEDTGDTAGNAADTAEAIPLLFT